METFNKGLNLDSPNKLQPDGTYRFALNAILETKEGDYGSLSNERGTDVCLDLEEGWVVIGDQILNDDTFVLFITNNDDSALIHFNPTTCSYTTIIQSSDLNFSTTYPIDSLFRIRKGCERTLYFTDTINPYRVINIDAIDTYLDDNGNLDVERLNYTPDVSVPRIDSATVNDGGGNLPLGSYSFTIRYLDGDRNPTNWYYVTQSVNIYDESISSVYEVIDGGINLVVNDQGEGILGGVPQTSKSITLNISNLDDSYEYYQIGVVASINDTASPQIVYEMNRVAVGGPTDTTVITSLDEDGIIQNSLADVTVDNVNIQVVQAHEQKDNRLFLGGVSSASYNWIDFQHAANNINTKWVTRNIAPRNASTQGDPKNPSTPFEFKTFMGDEIYAFAIQYLFKDGSWSPAFHIPGREASASDLDLLTEGLQIPVDDLEHIPDTEFEFVGPVGGIRGIRRWKYENTFRVSDRAMGYYETNTDYPSTSCQINGEQVRVFPEGKIRHHRIPDRKRLSNTFEDNGVMKIRLIGAEFDNVTYPSSDIVGHRFLTARRSAINTTVIDNAVWFPPTFNGRNSSTTTQLDVNSLLTNTLEESVLGDSLLNQSFTDGDSQLYDHQAGTPLDKTTNFGRLLSPKLLVNNSILNYTYLQFLRELRYTEGSLTRTVDNTYDYPGANTSWRMSLFRADYFALPTLLTPINYANIEAKVKLNPRTVLTNFIDFSNNQDVANFSSSNPFDYVEINKSIPAFSFAPTPFPFASATKPFIVSLKQNVKPFPNLESLEYYSLNSSYIQPGEDNIVFGKDAYVTEFNVYNTYLIHDIDYTSNDPNKRLDSDYVRGIYIDSFINYDLLHNGNETDFARYDDQQNTFGPYNANKILFQTEPGVSAWTVNETVPSEYYGYNKDYSRIDYSKPAFSLNSDSTICSSCADSYPNRIYVSQQSFQEEISDAYRIIRVNDYTDLDASSGPIVDLFKNKDKLYSITPKSLFFIPTSPQRLTTNEDNIFVGAADVLAIPPARLTTSQSGYGGTTDKFSICTMEFGTVFVDDTSRRVFMLSDQLEELSNKGLSNFFDNNLGFTLQEELKKAGFSTLPLSTVNGIGNNITFDPKFRRIIISHKDYKPIGNIQQFPNPQSLNVEDVYFDGEKFWYYDIEASRFWVQTEFDESRWENKSFTISYSLEFGTWTSFHSYTPDWSMWNNRTFYTTQSSSINTHNFGRHQSYYGRKYPHIIEVVSNENPGADKVFGNLNYLSKVYDWDENLEEWYTLDDFTFDQVWAYTSDQSTGLMRIQPKGDDTFFNVSLNQPNSIMAVHESDNTWTLNDLRDVFTGHNASPISSRAWADKSPAWYLDKVPMSVDTEFRGFNQARLRDKFLNVRLYFLPRDDFRITTDFINTRYKQSFR